MNNEIFDKTNAARDELFNSLGTVDPDVISHFVNPAFMGGPEWPALRQAFNIIRTKDSTMIASTGLSDPFHELDFPNNGYRLEIIAETKEDLGNDIPSSWLFKLVYSVSQQAASYGELADYIAQHKVVTMELFADDIGLKDYQNTDCKIGVIIGVEHPNIPKHVQFPAEEIILATVQILTPDELEYVTEMRAEGRNKLHNLLQQKGLFHYISLNRHSMLKSNTSNSSKAWWKIW